MLGIDSFLIRSAKPKWETAYVITTNLWYKGNGSTKTVFYVL